MIRIVLADDQLLFVESLKSVLETRDKEIKVVDIAYNGLKAIECVERHNPDIILMDVRMPSMDGVEATRIIHDRFPKVHIIMLTTFDEDKYVHEAIHYGAAGYLLKDMSPNELIAAIHVIKKGVFLISPNVAKKIVKTIDEVKNLDNTKADRAEEFPLFKNLNKREIEILRLIAEGLDNKRIAEELFLAEQTVKNYVSSIYSKLGVHDRIEAMKIAIKAELST